jgi:hypothetical protein
MSSRRIIACAFLVTLTACGNHEFGQAPVPEDPPATEGGGAAAVTPAEPEVGVGPLLTEIPDPCQYLTQADAEELLEAPTGPGRSLDAGGWNCVYDTGEPRRRLVFDIQLGLDDNVESSQIGMTINACEAEVVERFSDLGLDAALYRNTSAVCGDGTFLWVATGAYFHGEIFPGQTEKTTRKIHFSIALSPPGSGSTTTPVVLREAATRALARLAN